MADFFAVPENSYFQTGNWLLLCSHISHMGAVRLGIVDVILLDSLSAQNRPKQTPTLQDGWYVLCVRGKLVTTPKIPMNVLFRRCVGFGVRIAVWFRCSLSKVAENGSNSNKSYRLSNFSSCCLVYWRVWDSNGIFLVLEDLAIG